MQEKQKSYGNSYSQVKIKVKINKVKLLKYLIIFLFICEFILGILWALGK